MKAQEYFLRRVTLLYDTREKGNFELLTKLRHLGVEVRQETFQTADYSFEIDGKSYKSEWLGERKGSLNELYGNVMAGNKHTESALRNNLEEELQRKAESGIKEFILFVQGAKNLAEVKDFKEQKATVQGKRAGEHIYSTLMSWACANRYNFKICCAASQPELATEMLNHMYYYWRNDMKEKFGDCFMKILQGASNGR